MSPSHSSSSSFSSLLVALAIVICAIWGTGFISSQVVLSHGVPPFLLFCIRAAVAYSCLLLINHRRLYSGSLRSELFFLFMGLVGGSVYYSLENFSLRLTSAANVSFIVSASPLLALLLCVALFKHVRLSLRLFLGSLLALLGLCVLAFEDGSSFSSLHLGDFLSLLASLSWAVYSVALKFVPSGFSALFVTRKVFFYALVTILPFAVFSVSSSTSSSWLPALALPAVIGNIVYLSLFPSFFCYLGWNWVTSRLGAMQVVHFLYLEPVFTLLASLCFLSQSQPWQSLLACLAILAGVILATYQHGCRSSHTSPR